MGDPPCKFSVVGMGSLARKEITPYSDFEHIIVLDNEIKKRSDCESILNYFRWFTVIFQVVVINLQETIIPSVDIESLKWFYDNETTRGISFDGMMPHACKFSLGRQKFTEKKKWTTELIRPVDDMVELLTSKEDLKNGYHLKDILTRICYVAGSKHVFKDFEEKIVEMLNSQQMDEAHLEEIRDLLDDDLKSFAIRSNILKLKPTKSYNIKRDFYRTTTLFILALGKIHNIHDPSCFDIIEKYAQQGRICDKNKRKLMFAIALACELRLKWYMKRKRQDDLIENEYRKPTADEELRNLINISNLISYFQIAYALQCDISKQLKLKKIHFYSDPRLLNCKLYYRFGQLNDFINFARSYAAPINDKLKRLFSFEEIIVQLEQATKLQENKSDSIKWKSSQNREEENANLIFKLGMQFQMFKSYDEAIEFFEIYKDLLNKKEGHLKHCSSSSSQNLKLEQNMSKVHGQLGFCKMNMKNCTEALYHLKKWLHKNKDFSTDIQKMKEYARALNYVGACLLEISKPEIAKKYLLESKKIKQSISPSIDSVIDFAAILNNLGNFFFFFFFFFYLYIYPPDSQESDGGAIHRVSNYPDLLPEMPRYCCPLLV